MRHAFNRALNDLEADEKDFVKQRREGRVQELELGEDGKMYAHMDGGYVGKKVHGNFYRDENAQPAKQEKPRARRYKTGKPLPKARKASPLGDVELTEEQEQAWEAAQLARELAEEKRKLEERAEKLQEEQDAWEAAVAAVRAKETPEGEAAREQEEQEDAMLDELEAKLEELDKAREVGKQAQEGHV